MSPFPANLADATDLIRWADRLDSQSGLPRLIRRLILGSLPAMRQVSFRADEGVAVAGWDGITVSDQERPYIPEGVAGWELSARRDVKTKADEDYANRVTNPDNLDPAQTAFVFVTPRRWPGKRDWIAEKTRDGHFHSVHAFDADDLETWLEATPAVHLWLSLSLGKHSDNAFDLETWWRDWSHVVNPPLTTKFLLAGRAESVQAIQTLLRADTNSFAVRAESADEALAVFVASIYELPEAEQEGYLSRTIVVHDGVAFSHFAASDAPLILVPTFDDPNAIARALRRGHRVVLVLAASSPETSTTVTVPRLEVGRAAMELKAAGLDEDTARELAVMGRRSLMAFRRKRAIRPEAQTPLWARPETAARLLPFFLAGSWNESNEADLQLLATMAQTEPPRVQEAAIRWSREVDPLLRSVGSFWYLASKEDTWILLSPFLSRADLERFETAALTVLTDRDPRFDLSADERWMSTDRSVHSGALHEGIAETLAVMGAQGASVSVAGVSVAQWADRIVRKLLQRANQDWRIWASLSGQLSLLAEAAPTEFLAAVEQGLSGEQILMKLFVDQGHPLFSFSPHTGLLWALERLSWSPDHLARASAALARLARLDPGGKGGNRPRGSLRDTFLIWHPQTTAPWTQQLQVLNMLLEREQDAGWTLHKDILPESHGVMMNRTRPQWRDWAPQEAPRPTVSEQVVRINDVVSQMLTHVGTNGPRWTDLIEACPDVTKEAHDAIVDQLAALDPDGLAEGDRVAIWSALRQVVGRHRSFPDAHWVLPKDRIDRLADLYERLAPQDSLAKFEWLFANHVLLPSVSEMDWQAKDKALEEARQNAVAEIHASSGVQGIENLIGRVKDPLQLGLALGLSRLDVEDDRLLRQYLASDDPHQAGFARGFVFGRIGRDGKQWAHGKILLPELSILQRAAILVCLPAEKAVWDIAGGDDSLDEAYWQKAWRHIKGSADEIEYAAKKMAKFGRAFAAAELLAYRLKDADPPSPSLIAEMLEAALVQKKMDPVDTSGFAYWLGELLDVLASSDVDEARVARIEWAFSPLLYHDRPLTVLHRELARNPTFFAELLSFAYRPENAEPKESTKEEQTRGNTAYHVLDSWKTLPGSAGGVVDAAALSEWVDKALALSAEACHPRVGAQHVGQVLSHAPVGTDGAWPHEAVRDIIERVANPDVESGLHMGRFNGRGVTTRSLTGGGRQERELADQYAGWVRQTRDRWPRTAAALGSLEETYRTMARREDDETDLRRDGLW